MDLFKALVLGLIQGLTEFLPISSSAHLAIFPKFFGWGDPGAAFTAVIQIGTEVAVVVYFWRDIWFILSGWCRAWVHREQRAEQAWRLGWFVIIGSVPIVVLGIALKDLIEQDFRNLWVIGTTLVVLGVILGIADRIGRQDKQIDQLTVKHAILFGCAQACALIPGVSRSGATISMGRFLGYERAAATRYSFLLAIPAVLGAGIFELKDIPGGENAYGTGATVIATVVSFAVGIAVIHWLLAYVSKHDYKLFVGYRILLGAVTLILVSAGVIAASTTVG